MVHWQSDALTTRKDLRWFLAFEMNFDTCHTKGRKTKREAKAMQLSWFRSLPCQGPKKSRFFHGPPLPMALVMDVARIKIITSRAILTTGTLIKVSKYGRRGRANFSDSKTAKIFQNRGGLLVKFAWKSFFRCM
jgi:hypothetical protein